MTFWTLKAIGIVKIFLILHIKLIYIWPSECILAIFFKIFGFKGSEKVTIGHNLSKMCAKSQLKMSKIWPFAHFDFFRAKVKNEAPGGACTIVHDRCTIACTTDADIMTSTFCKNCQKIKVMYVLVWKSCFYYIFYFQANLCIFIWF